MQLRKLAASQRRRALHTTHPEVPLVPVPPDSFANQALQQLPETQILDYQPEVIAGLDLHLGLLLE